MDIVCRILKLVKEKNITGVEIGKMLGLAKSPLTDWKNGKANPTLEQLILICEKFAISADYLLLGKDNAEPLPNSEIATSLSNSEQELLDNYRKLDSRGKYKLQTFIYDELDRVKSDHNIREAITKGSQYTFDLPLVEGHKNPIKK